MHTLQSHSVRVADEALDSISANSILSRLNFSTRVATFLVLAPPSHRHHPHRNYRHGRELLEAHVGKPSRRRATAPLCVEEIVSSGNLAHQRASPMITANSDRTLPTAVTTVDCTRLKFLTIGRRLLRDAPAKARSRSCFRLLSEQTHSCATRDEQDAEGAAARTVQCTRREARRAEAAGDEHIRHTSRKLGHGAAHAGSEGDPLHRGVLSQGTRVYREGAIRPTRQRETEHLSSFTSSR